jgi:alkaline phosphatase D
MGFRFGVASGDVSHDSIVLWARVDDPGSSVTWHCKPVVGSSPVQQGTVSAAPDSAAVHALVTGLTAGIRYRYWFTQGGDTSAEGLFRTIPTDRAVRFAVVSCAKFNSGYFNAYRAIADRDDIDFVLHLGDYIYEAAEVPRGKQTAGADIGRPMDPLNDCITFTDYDTRYAQYRGDADLSLLHTKHAMIATLDDHELSDNAWKGGAEEHDPTRDGPWADRRAAALRAWSDWMPTLRRPDLGEPVWYEISLGTAGRIILTEARLNRTDPDAPDGPEKTALGAEQREWLLSRLNTAVDGWTIAAMPSMLASVEAAAVDPDALFALRKLKLTESDEVVAFHDLWESFRWERDQLRDAVRFAPHSMVISGDVHFSAAHQDSTSNFIEWTATSITSPNLDDKMGWPRGAESRNYEAALLKMLPDLSWCDLDSHGYLIIEANAQYLAGQWWFVDTVREASDDFTMGHEVVIPMYPEGTEAVRTM